MFKFVYESMKSRKYILIMRVSRVVDSKQYYGNQIKIALCSNILAESMERQFSS